MHDASYIFKRFQNGSLVHSTASPLTLGVAAVSASMAHFPSTYEIDETLLVGRTGGRRQRFIRKLQDRTEGFGIRLFPERMDSRYRSSLGRAAMAELLGSLIFTFLGAGIIFSTGYVVQKDRLDSARLLTEALGQGTAFAIAVATTYALSGGHINPAVTLAFIGTGRMDAFAGLVYWASQFVGAFLGAGLLLLVWGRKWRLGTHAFTFAAHVGFWRGLLVEALITFLLVWTYWSAVVHSKGFRSIAPFLVGLAVLMANLLALPLTGASLNPAASFAASLWSGKWGHFWAFLLGPLLGALLAALLFEFTFIRPVAVVGGGPEDVFEEIILEEPGESTATAA
eukprot:jgi/Mesen1/1313/ME000013S00809